MLIRGHKVLKRFTNAHVLPLFYNHIIALDEMEEKLEIFEKLQKFVVRSSGI